MKNTINRQVKIMEKQLESYESITAKMGYMSNFFDPDPEFTQEARDIVRSNICKANPNKEQIKLTKIWINNCIEGKPQLILDFSNDEHHALPLFIGKNSSCKEDVVNSLLTLASNIANYSRDES